MALADPFYSLVTGRQSIRRFTSEPVDAAVLRRVLHAAVRAPSAHNRQPWRFVVLSRGKQRDKLVEAMTGRWRDDLLDDGKDEDEISRLTARNQGRLLAPAALIMLFLTMEDLDAYPDAFRRHAERTMAVQSVALAGGHILLAAEAENLGACWICGPLFVPELIRETLALSETWEAQGVIAIGHPADEGRERERRALDEVVLWR